MATILPPCPKCGGTLRNLATDEAQCRCGFTISGEAILHARSTSPIAEQVRLLGAGYMVSPPDAKPGIYIAEHYAELTALCWDIRAEPRQRPRVAVEMRAAAIATGSTHGLTFEHDRARGAFLVVQLPDGGERQLERQKLYGLAPFGQEVEAARRMAERIVALRGPGRWWSLLDPVHCIEDDGLIKVADVGGVPHVILRALYCHLAVCPLCRQPCDRVTVGGGIKLSGCECFGTGDRVVAFSAADNRVTIEIDPEDL